MMENAKFWDRIAPGYAKKPVADQAAYEHKLAMTQEYLRPEMSVFEFGCGTGTTALIHAPYVKHILATDLSQGMIDIARGKAEAESITNVTFQVSGIDDVSAADGTYDVIMGHSILHLLTNMEEVIAKVHRMLKPGGLFIANTVCLEGALAWVLRLVLPVGRLFGLVPFVRFLSHAELTRFLRDANFQIEQHWRPESGNAVFIIARKPN